MRRILLASSFLTLSACGTTTTAGCSSDEDCDGTLICIEGGCICRTDDMCGDGEYCNPFGTCQVRPACLGNADCNNNEICNSADPTGGKCISNDTCGSSVHCELGSYCSPTDNVCTPGCRSTGDCRLGEVCVGGNCVVGGTGGNCDICPTSPVPDASYCDYGEVCTTAGECVAHPQAANLCDTCDGLFSTCPSGSQCLVDDATGGQYCAPECTTDADCPSGYQGCGGTSMVNGAKCGDFMGVGPCDCTDSGTCPNPAARCLFDSESTIAFCECVEDSDCSAMDPSLSCVQRPDGSGGTIGKCMTNWKACGKGEGVHCDQLTGGVSDCRIY